MTRFLFSAILLSILSPTFCFADFNHNLMRRIVIFPIKVNRTLSDVADISWHKMRLIVIENKRFLLASKDFMRDKDVLHARGELKTSDAVILSDLLDAQALVVTYLKRRVLYMKVYSKKYGRELWSNKVKLNSSYPIKGQIEKSSLKLIQDFIASIPYQGYVVVDPSVKATIYRKDGSPYVSIDVGVTSGIQIGEVAQFIQISSSSLKPLFHGHSKINVIAEGEVTKVNSGILTVEIKKYINLLEIKPQVLVRFPEEEKRLREHYKLSEDSLLRRISPKYFSSALRKAEEEEQERPLLATLAFLLNAVLFLLVAL